MNDHRQRYVRLAPLDIEQETKLALMALHFFSPASYRNVCGIIGKTPAPSAIQPMSGLDFIKYLKATGFSEDPHVLVYKIRHLLEGMAANNILVEMPPSDPNFVLIPKNYYALGENSTIRSKGILWLARTLGGRFVHRQVCPAIVHIVGEDPRGDARSGSGVVFDSHHILTCRHVLTHMAVSRTQSFQGRRFTVEENAIASSRRLDIAVLRVKEPLQLVPGLAFLSPFVGQTVYTFGYPRVPGALPPPTGESPLVMQRGEVTNDAVRVLGDTELFLYSAITRPGNSGGAIVSDDGYVVGIATELAEGQYEGIDPFSPHYGGIPAHVVAEEIDQMALGVQIPYETFD